MTMRGMTMKRHDNFNFVLIYFFVFASVTFLSINTIFQQTQRAIQIRAIHE
jgi:hypothetical protein